MRPRKDRERVDAVRRDDPDRDEEEDDEPADRQAEQAGAGQVEPRPVTGPSTESASLAIRAPPGLGGLHLLPELRVQSRRGM